MVYNDDNHLCSIFNNEDQQFSTCIPLIINHLKTNYQTIYITDTHQKEEILNQFKIYDFDILPFIDSQQFKIVSQNESYLRDNDFTPLKTIDFIISQKEKAKNDGFNGIFMTGEMTWVNIDPQYSKSLVEYESLLDQYFSDNQVKFLCQYDETKFDPSVLINIIRTHNYLYIYGNKYQNKYLYHDPSLSTTFQPLPSRDYTTIVNIITND